MYSIFIKKRAEKFISKAEKNLKILLKSYLDNLSENLFMGEELKKDKKGIYSFHFKYSKTDYRIAYLIEQGELHILLIGTRENFYKELTQIL